MKYSNMPIQNTTLPWQTYQLCSQPNEIIFHPRFPWNSRGLISRNQKATELWGPKTRVWLPCCQRKSPQRFIHWFIPQVQNSFWDLIAWGNYPNLPVAPRSSPLPAKGSEAPKSPPQCPVGASPNIPASGKEAWILPFGDRHIVLKLTILCAPSMQSSRTPSSMSEIRKLEATPFGSPLGFSWVRYNLTRLVVFSKPCPNCPQQKAILFNWALFREDDYDGMRFDKG